MKRTICDPISRRATSLIETVTTVGTVIAMLLVLAPGLSHVQRSAKETRCLSNLAKISDAAAIYAADDMNELLIPAHPRIGVFPGERGEVEWGGRSGMGQPSNGTLPWSSAWGASRGRGASTRPMNNIFYKDGFRDVTEDPGDGAVNWINDSQLNLDVYHCPSDYGYTGSHLAAWKGSKLTSYDHYGNSYCANMGWIGLAGAGCTLMSNSPFMRHASLIPAPARTLLFLEHCGRYAWRQNYGIDGCSSLSGTPFPTDPIIRGWHSAEFTFNVAFCDGHAASTYINGHLHPQPHISRYPNFANGNPTDYDTWRCVIIRGVDWQQDTLPSPPIPTSFPCSYLGAEGFAGGEIGIAE